MKQITYRAHIDPAGVREPSSKTSAGKESSDSISYTTAMTRNQYATKECSTRAAEGAEPGQVEKAHARQFGCTALVGVKTAPALAPSPSLQKAPEVEQQPQ